MASTKFQMNDSFTNYNYEIGDEQKQILADGMPAKTGVESIEVIATADATDAGVAYDETVAQSAVDLVNELKATVNSLITALKA